MDFLKDFGINPMLLAAQVVNFLVLLFILKKLLYGPILKVLAERKKTIEQSLKNAQEIEKKLLMTEEEKEKILAKAADQAQKMLDETKKEQEVMRLEGKEQTEKMVEEMLRKGEENAKAEMEKMRQELMSNFADVVALGMEKVTGKSFSSKEKREIIEKEVRNLS